MEGSLLHMCSGNKERNILEINAADLKKKILVLNLGKQWAKIILNDLEGWVPQECLHINQIQTYLGRLSAEEVENKLKIAPEKSSAMYMKMANFYLAVKMKKGKFNHIPIYRRDGEKDFIFQEMSYKSLNELERSVLEKSGEGNLYKLTEKSQDVGTSKSGSRSSRAKSMSRLRSRSKSGADRSKSISQSKSGSNSKSPSRSQSRSRSRSPGRSSTEIENEEEADEKLEAVAAEGEKLAKLVARLGPGLAVRRNAGLQVFKLLEKIDKLDKCDRLRARRKAIADRLNAVLDSNEEIIRETEREDNVQKLQSRSKSRSISHSKSRSVSRSKSRSRSRSPMSYVRLAMRPRPGLSARPVERENKQRKCGLCRQPGHTRNRCPMKNGVDMFI
jgi:hypothetical protein